MGWMGGCEKMMGGVMTNCAWSSRRVNRAAALVLLFYCNLEIERNVVDTLFGAFVIMSRASLLLIILLYMAGDSPVNLIALCMNQ